MSNRQALLATLLFLTLVGCSRSEEDSLVYVKKDDPGIATAIEKAKATSGDFIVAFKARSPGTSDFYVKKPYPTTDDGSEHMWIEVQSVDDDTLTGNIANDAIETKEVKLGQTVTLKLSEISDWKYQEGRKMVGGYTIRYFIDRMLPKEKAAFLEESGIEL